MTQRILLMGSPRSGTTWIGKMLGHAPDTVYVDEPDLVEVPETGQVGRHGFGPYPIIAPGERSPRAMRFGALWDLAFADVAPQQHASLMTLGRAMLRIPAPIRDPLTSAGARLISRVRRPRRHIVAKSVVGQFALEWIVDRYRPAMVLIQRHPLNVVASWLTLPEPLYGLPENSAVREGVVEPLGFPAAPPPASHLEQATWCVGLLTATLHLASVAHPGWPVVTHEEMCDDPVDRFRVLAGELGLAWSDASSAAVRESQRPGTGYVTNRIAAELPEKWRRVLSAEDAAAAMRVLDGFPAQGWIRPPDVLPMAAVQP